MHITPARPADLPEILRMIRALSTFHGETAAVSLDTLPSALFDSPLASAFVARSDRALIGYAGLTYVTVLHSGKTRIDIHHLYVDEPHRNSGIGKSLIAAAREHAQTTGASALSIGTDMANKTAQAAYRAMGLEEITGSGPRFRIALDQ